MHERRQRSPLLFRGLTLLEAVWWYRKRLVRRRLHTMQLEAVPDWIPPSEKFHSPGQDQGFLLHSSKGQLPTDWVVISYVMESQVRRPRLRLYIDTGGGFLDDQWLALPARRQGRVRFIACLPGQLRSLLLRVSPSAPRCWIQGLTIEEIGVIQVVGMMLWHHLRPIVFHPQQVLQFTQELVKILVRDGVGAAKRRFLTQERTVSEYQEWIDAYDSLTSFDRSAIQQHIDRLVFKPLISVVISASHASARWLRRAIESVQSQLYPHWELCLVADTSTKARLRRVLEKYGTNDTRIRVIFHERPGDQAAAVNAAISTVRGDFLTFLGHTDELTEHALYMVAVEVNAHPDAALIYSDEDRIDPQQRRFDPYFKPEWNPDLFLSQNFVRHLGVLRTEEVRKVGGIRAAHGEVGEWDLALRVVERISASQIRHIPAILYHRRTKAGFTTPALVDRPATHAVQAMLTAHFARMQRNVEIHPLVDGRVRVRYPLPRCVPLVTLIIPTRNRFDLLYRCLESIYHRTTYANFELIVVDNQSDDPTTLRYLRRLVTERGVRVLRYDAPFNYSAINNFAVRHARGALLGFLNNDVEVITPTWLEEMVSHALRPEIGAVGAMLYYPNDTIQHAGVIVGMGGVAGHPYLQQKRGYPGHRSRTLYVQNFSAVTAACLVIRRQLFEEVGGLDERHLPVAFNDVDFCLRLAERGYRNLWTPYAELYHHESASRGHEDTPEKARRFKAEIAYMKRRWGGRLLHDAAYNPNLALDRECFTLAFPPRRQNPWQAYETGRCCVETGGAGEWGDSAAEASG